MHYLDAMRTTLAIDDRLLAAAKRRARQHGMTLGQLVEEALQAELAASPAPNASRSRCSRGETACAPRAST